MLAPPRLSGGQAGRRQDLQGGVQAGGQDLPHDLHPAVPVCGGELDEPYPNLKVDVHHPELTVYLEVRDYAAYVHADPEPGAGGLPVGMGGRAVSLLSGGIDSPVASWMIAKRGIALEMVHFFSYPYTSERGQAEGAGPGEAAHPLVRRLMVHVVPFTAIQEELRRKTARRSCSPCSCAGS